MTPAAARRWTIVEYGDPVALVDPIATATGLNRGRVRELIDDVGARVGAALGLEVPLHVLGGSVRAIGFAGMITLAPGLELEVVPKFLSTEGSWREDFFLLALIARHGHVFDDALHASPSSETDLGALVARALVASYWRHHRRPIRSYERSAVTFYALEGEFDPVDLLFAEGEGFPQTVTALTRRNHHNAVIAAAASTLAPLVQDAEARLNLERVAHHLPRQVRPAGVEARRLPGRSRVWQSTYDLALSVLRGQGGSYAAGSAEAPGYVLETWRAWEALLTLSLRMHFGSRVVQAQRDRQLGEGRRPGGARRLVTVAPDVVVANDDPFIVDAKYKGRVGRGKQPVLPADLYEALAFARATNQEIVVLAYPRVSRPGGEPPIGTTGLIETVRVEGISILAVEVATAGIAARGGLALFARGFGTAIRGLVADERATKP